MEIIRLDKVHKTHHRDESAIPEPGDFVTSEHSTASMNDKPSTVKPRIAIVDDDPGMRSFITRVLRLTGLATVSFESGEAFLQEQLREPSVCVLLDLSMPGISGFEVKDRLAKSYPNVPVILITGQTDLLWASSHSRRDSQRASQSLLIRRCCCPQSGRLSDVPKRGWQPEGFSGLKLFV